MAIVTEFVTENAADQNEQINGRPLAHQQSAAVTHDKALAGAAVSYLKPAVCRCVRVWKSETISRF